MLRHLPILIVEDEPLIALSLALEIEDVEGIVVGPAATVSQALTILQTQAIAAAILGSGLIDQSQKMTVAAMQMADMKV